MNGATDIEKAAWIIRRAEQFNITLDHVKLPRDINRVPEVHNNDCFYLSMESHHSYEDIRAFFPVPHQRTKQQRTDDE